LACQWRIRHKLMLGLGLVVGLVGVLLAGALKGLASYRATVSMFDSKLVELHAVRELKAQLLLIPSLQPGLVIPSEVKPRVAAARLALTSYQDKLQETILRRRDPENGFHETQLIQAMEERFGKLEKAIEDLDDEQVNKAIRGPHGLLEATDELYGAIYKDLFDRMARAKSDFKSSLAIVLSISIFGILLMTGLLRFFYRWTFFPLRDLQAGVGRVAQGNFEHAIEVHSGDEIEELAAAFNDMTRRLRDIYSDLARQVNERSRQLVRSERLASVGFLAAGVAHEINNPLASIAFCSEALEARLQDCGLDSPSANPQSNWEIVAKYLKMIQEEAFRCKKITQRLLEFSRGGERSREPTDLVEIVQSVLEMVQHGPWSKGKEIVFTGVEDTTSSARPGATVGLVASVNAEEIKSVVLNLVINALDSMDEGGRLTITLRQRNGMAELIFADTGCGMTAEVLENLFEPFFTRSRTGKGTGLGLSISHRIINQHGGEIEATSPGPDRGSTFTVRIPLRPTEPAAEEPPGRAAA
jgi:signal transduction histidine kinase